MTKERDAFRTIGEVSDELVVPKHVLRFWEGRFPQLKPMKRGGGRRFYRPEDVQLLRGIHHLLHKAGYTIKGVQRILREHGQDTVKLVDGATEPLAARTPTDDQPGAAVAAARKRGKARDPVVAPLTTDQRDIIARIAAELQGCLALLNRAA
jgi:DNA-binding transcriptional MerR regulator